MLTAEEMCRPKSAANMTAYWARSNEKLNTHLSGAKYVASRMPPGELILAEAAQELVVDTPRMSQDDMLHIVRDGLVIQPSATFSHLFNGNATQELAKEADDSAEQLQDDVQADMQLQAAELQDGADEQQTEGLTDTDEEDGESEVESGPEPLEGSDEDEGADVPALRPLAPHEGARSFLPY